MFKCFSSSISYFSVTGFWVFIGAMKLTSETGSMWLTCLFHVCISPHLFSYLHTWNKWRTRAVQLCHKLGETKRQFRFQWFHCKESSLSFKVNHTTYLSHFQWTIVHVSLETMCFCWHSRFSDYIWYNNCSPKSCLFIGTRPWYLRKQ